MTNRHRGFEVGILEAAGAISIVLGPAPSPLLADVTLAQTIVPFSYTFAC